MQNFLATTAGGLITYKSGIQKRIPFEHRFVYYGLTWDHKKVYLTKLIGKSDILLKIEGVQVTRQNWPGDRCHQAFFDPEQNKLYSAITSRDDIDIIDFGKEGQRTEWHINPNSTRDTLHINSVWRDDDSVWICEHRFGDSHIKRFDLNQELLEEYKIGKCSHNVFRIGDILYTCSSRERKLIMFDLKKKAIVKTAEAGKELKIPENMGWLRGMGVTPDHKFIIGASQEANKRRDTLIGDSYVFTTDADLNFEKSVVLKDAGNIFEVRLLEQDLAHNGLPCPVDFDAINIIK